MPTPQNNNEDIVMKEDNIEELNKEVAVDYSSLPTFNNEDEEKEYLLSIFDPNGGNGIKDRADLSSHGIFAKFIGTNLFAQEEKLKSENPEKYDKYIADKKEKSDAYKQKEIKLAELFKKHEEFMESKGISYYAITDDYGKAVRDAFEWSTPLRLDVKQRIKDIMEFIEPGRYEKSVSGQKIVVNKPQPKTKKKPEPKKLVDIAEQVADKSRYVINFEGQIEKETEYLLSIFDPNNGNKEKDEQDKQKYIKVFLVLGNQLENAEWQLKSENPEEYKKYIEEKEQLQEIRDSRESQLKDLFTTYSGLAQSKGIKYYEKTGNFSVDLASASRLSTPLRKDIIDDAKKALELVNRFKDKADIIDVDNNKPKVSNDAYQISPELKRMKPDTLVANRKNELSSIIGKKELNNLDKAVALDTYSQIKRIHDQRKKPRWYNFFYRPAYNREKKYIANLEKQLLAKNVSAKELCDSIFIKGYSIVNDDYEKEGFIRDNKEFKRLIEVEKQVAPTTGKILFDYENNNLLSETVANDKENVIESTEVASKNLQERLNADIKQEAQPDWNSKTDLEETYEQLYNEHSKQ